MPAEEPSAPSAQDAEQGQTDPPSKLDTASRLSGEQRPGPSRVAPRQGYCSCCQIVYNSVEQHILSPRHREAVRGSRTQVISGSLMERFLLDVVQHHPHHYNDPRPTHADLPSLNSPLVPREELSDVCLSDNDGASLGTREDMPGSDDSSCQLVHIQDEEVAPATTASQPEEGRGGKAWSERLTPPGPDQDTRPSPLVKTRAPSPGCLHTLSQRPCSPHTPPLVHRKAHRKTNRRRERSSSSSSSSLSPPAAHVTSQQEHQPTPEPREQSPDPEPRTESSAWAAWGAKPPWRRDAPRDEAFSSDHSDPVGDVIEEVIQRHCYGRSPAQRHQGDTGSFHLSLPESLGGGGSGDSEDWDAPVQEALGRGRAEGRQDAPGEAGAAATAPGQGGEQESRDLACLMDVRVNLEDQGYTSQLDTALNADTRAGGGAAGAAAGETYREPAVEEILPALPHIPASFLGKTWTQVLLEDELKVEALVREFRQGCLLSYFDSESLARYGRRSRKQKGRGQTGDQAWEANVLPLAEHDEDDPECTRRKGRHRGRRRSFRMASRCQVVKVSHGTQTTPLVAPAVRQLALLQTGTAPDSQTLRQDPGAESEKTPEMKTRLCSLRLPPSYTRIMTPLQPKTSLVYVLSSPETPPTDPRPRLKPIARGDGRKRKRSRDVGVKVKYKRVPLRYYDPATNRILKTPPKGLLASLTPGPARAPQPHVVRQLFRSLSPDINSERQGGGGGERRDGSGASSRGRRGRSAGSTASGSQLEPGAAPPPAGGVKGQGSSDAGSSVTSPFGRSSLSNSGRFLLGAPPEPPSDPEAASRRRGGRDRARRRRRTSPSGPPSPEKGPSPPHRPRRPGTGRGGEKPVSRSSKRGRRPRLTPSPPPAAGLSPSPPPRRGPLKRAVESRKLLGPKGPAGAAPQRAPPASLKPPRAVGVRSSPRLAPAPLPPRTLRSRVRR